MDRMGRSFRFWPQGARLAKGPVGLKPPLCLQTYCALPCNTNQSFLSLPRAPYWNLDFASLIREAKT